MNRPARSFMNPKSLSIIGIPKKFHTKTLNDFNTYDQPSLNDIKQFVKEYMDAIPDKFDNGSGIFFYGSNGVGKTFLSCLIAKEAYRLRYSVRRVTFVSYISLYTRSWGASADDRDAIECELNDEYKAVEFLILEEVGKEIDSKVAAPILEDLLRYREDQGLVTVLCTNLPPESLVSRYGESVLSLLQGNMTPIMINEKDRRRESFDER